MTKLDTHLNDYEETPLPSSNRYGTGDHAMAGTAEAGTELNVRRQAPEQRAMGAIAEKESLLAKDEQTGA
jgi:hypothetical protein